MAGAVDAALENARLGIASLASITAKGLDGKAIELTPFEVFSAEAVVTAQGANASQRMALPGTRYFSGRRAGDAQSHIFLAIRPDGALRGVVRDATGVWLMHDDNTGEAGRVPAMRRMDMAADLAGASFECGHEGALPHAMDLGVLVPVMPDAPSRDAKAASDTYTVTIGLETDFEFYQLFGSSAATLQYIADLFAYISSIYQANLGTRLVIGDTFLWTTSADPWNATDTSSALNEFASYWYYQRSAVKRATAHFLSGKRLGGGIAYVGALCNGAGYGFSASLAGNFDLDQPRAVWDAIVVAHEIGHNFNSPHTHCYNGIAGNASPVDACYTQSGCWSGAVGLPGVGALTGGTAGAGNGTLMSYCHQRTGGYGNIAMTFGKDHVYGVQASRVSDRMRAYVESSAALYPQCVVKGAATPVLTVATTGTGAGTVTSHPAGIDCGSDCQEGYAVGTQVTLTANAGVASRFVAWSGACAGSALQCLVTVDANKSVTATFANILPEDNFPRLDWPGDWVEAGQSSALWSIVGDTVYAGANALRSGSVAHGAMSGISYSAHFQAGDVRFARKVSSEVGDYLRFYVDGTSVAEWAGEQDWSEVALPLTAGNHVLSWRYIKNPVTVAGADAAWIDALVLPENTRVAFGDVPADHWAADAMRAIYARNITLGCGGGDFCPAQPVTREQMAAFIIRALEGEPAADACAGGAPFSDVPASHWACGVIKRLKERGITTGYGDGSFAPTGYVTRAQMAALLVRALDGGDPASGYCGANSGYGDVANTDAFCGHIKRLAELGVTTGCGGGNYCPGLNVTREQMATFLVRAFLNR
jgi:hypothetical protein